MSKAPILLDCTVRDGSCAIDFKFTADDTATLVGLLSEAGVGWIEICDGWGLGANAKRAGIPTTADRDAIERSRDRAGSSKLGAFFVPWLGSDQDLRDAAAAGLDFIRIGHHADKIDQVMPFVELARELGLQVFVNFMKTYGVTVADFARSSEQAVARGAHGVYVVDSAGGMMPAEVRSYVAAARESVAVPIGFHGHNNLHLAVANAIAAWKAGATFIDTTVTGIGRSSGNAPTEIVAAVFERLGHSVGVDALAVMDLAEAYLTPITERLTPHSMTEVAMGVGQFYSAYAPRALAAADKAGINPLQLIVELGRRDPMTLPADLLERTVADLAGTTPSTPTLGRLDRFPGIDLDPRRNGEDTLNELLHGLETIAGKLRLAVVLGVIHSDELAEDELAVEYVLHDDAMVLGRLRCGSAGAANAALAAHESRIELALAAPGIELPALRGRVVPYRPDSLALDYLGDVALARLAAAGPRDRVLLVDDGSFASDDVDVLAKRLEATRADAPTDDAFVVVVGHLTEPPRGGVAFAGSGVDPDPAAGLIGRDDCLRGTLPRWLRALAAVPLRVEAVAEA